MLCSHRCPSASDPGRQGKERAHRLRRVKHRVEEHVLHNAPQAAGARLLLDGLSRDCFQGRSRKPARRSIVSESLCSRLTARERHSHKLHAACGKEVCVLLHQGELGFAQDPHEVRLGQGLQGRSDRDSSNEPTQTRAISGSRSQKTEDSGFQTYSGMRPNWTRS